MLTQTEMYATVAIFVVMFVAAIWSAAWFEDSPEQAVGYHDYAGCMAVFAQGVVRILLLLLFFGACTAVLWRIWF